MSCSHAKRAGLEVGSIYELMTCPYNPAHKVGVTRLPMHLVRCREQHPDLAAKMDICFWNQTHHVLKSDMPYHLMICPEHLEFRQRARERAIADGYVVDFCKVGKSPPVGRYILHTEKLAPGEVYDSDEESDGEPTVNGNNYDDEDAKSDVTMVVEASEFSYEGDAGKEELGSEASYRTLGLGRGPGRPGAPATARRGGGGGKDDRFKN